MSRIVGFVHDRVAADGHQIEYFSRENLPARWQGPIAKFSFPTLAFQFARREALASRPFDVINVHEPSALLFVILRRWLGNPKIAVTSHGLEQRGWDATREDHKLGRSNIRLRTRAWHPLTVVWPSNAALRGADHVFCLNSEDRRLLESDYSIAPAKITRMFPGADPEYVAAFERRDYSSPPIRILWFGTWLVRKGNLDMVQSFESLAARFPQLRLTIMGAGFSAPTVLASFPPSIQSRVDYVPHVATDSARHYAQQMLQSAVYVLPSVFEGTPLTLMEAMATGLPVVASNICGMRDVIRHRENGLLTPIRSHSSLTEAISTLLTDDSFRARLGRQAHADVVENYSWDKVAEPIRCIYQRWADERRQLDIQRNTQRT